MKIDGINPKERWGLIPKLGQHHPLTAEIQLNTMSIPGMDGEWDFGSDLKPIPFNLSFRKIEMDKHEMQRKLKEFAVFLCDSYGKPRPVKLTYDYEPDRYYEVKLSKMLNPDRMANVTDIEVPFIAHKPHAQFIVPSNKISWDSDVPFYSDILWGMDQTEYKIISPQTINVVYSGTKAIRAGFKLQGTGSNVKVSANGKTMTFGNMNSTTYEVDGETYTIKKNGVDSLVSTEFIELIHGENKISISGSSLNLTFSEQLTYQFI